MFEFARSRVANAYKPVSYRDHNISSEDQSTDDLLERKVPITYSVKELPEKTEDRRWGPFFLKLLFLENIVLLFIIAAYALTKQLTADPIDDFDAHGSLKNYNTTQYFSFNPEYVFDSAVADNFWKELEPYGGIVSFNSQRALMHGLAPSAVSPTNPDESVYQVNVYHSLHCLNRLRRLLVANSTSDVRPADDGHTPHCIDYLRQTIMCHSDLMLGSTDDLAAFGLKEKHKCRDYGAILRWVKRNAWEGYDEMRAKQKAGKQKAEEQSKVGPEEV